MLTAIVPRPSVYSSDIIQTVPKDTSNKNVTDDPVNHPSHYTYGNIECIDYIEDKGFDFCLGNAVKYITRAGHKVDAIEDLKKAIFYINRKIAQLERSNA